MAFREIRRFGDPVLRTPAEPVTVFDDRLRSVVADLLDTVDAPGHAGLAAPQIGVGIRAFSYNVDGEIGYVVNPEVVELSEEQQEGPEGCLSVPELWFDTPRARHAVVRGVDADNEPVTVSGSGLMARCLQHETDHLDGMIYVQRLAPDRRRDALRRIRETDWFWQR
ncbi:peptide deformylase [Saccharopolyspora erythraea NRRL 2338]|uniref:Peptide deformylase n=2 Tax=Saccharopolyspora erythraea TaxID=1836 RepID=A4FM28_SACEN|nr:peptide deformylase [Saccharopolyspora erythraea]EQD88238.1 peptide deformylase [Saccharopolyspora erythraea D]PFG98742.1 peptide deformylase [Saccharopolyspora erythraea NRRL 2338]QRK88749.1 peptide deformylase [Saccharopolyspora erythraea]CAM05103.1 polypeptide deformylase [Saccharopolyspora erythraea NRRL 2338]